MNKKLLVPGVLAAGLLFGGAVQAVEPDNNTVDGTATYYSTGAIVPSQVEFIGYDVRADNIYLDITLESSEALPDSVPYSVNVTNGSSNDSLVNSGELFKELTPDPDQTTPEVNDSSVNDRNVEVDLISSLTSDYRVLVEVDEDRAGEIAAP